MKSGFILIGVLLCMFLVPFSGQNEAEAEIVYLAGDEDEFAAPSDLASPSAELSTAFGYLWPGGVQDFDLTGELNGGSNNRPIAHTFYNLPPGIVDATLEFKIQAGNDIIGAPDDDFWLLFYDEITSVFDINKKAYRVAIGNRNSTTQGLSGIEWGPESQPEVVKITLDLSSLPLPDGSTISVIEDMENYGFLDVVVADDTAVDYYKLTVYPTTADDILDFFDDSVDNGELGGLRINWIWESRFRVFFMRLMLVVAGEYIENGNIDRACSLLPRVYLRCDGEPWPQDFVVGGATEGLSEMIVDLMENLECD